MKVYSYSKLQTYEQCALKYKFRYIDKIRVEVEETIEGFLGKCVHSVLEFLYNERMQEKGVDIDELIKYYLTVWEKNFSDKFLIVKSEMKAEDYFNKGIKFLTNYYSRNYPFVEKTIATERKIFIELNEKSGLVGFVDRLAYNEKDDVYEIHDYKTGALKSEKQLEFDRQLALYSLALKEEFKDGRDILLIWHYLDHDEKIILKKTGEQLEVLKKQVLELINEIENAGVFPYTKSRLCHWCEFKGICPAWQMQTSLFDFR
ncbi:MAG: PD-(D/E)XK nuclease family protein [Nanoarchaeota archaeon]